MSDRATKDDDVSPMEAQNTGPAKTGGPDGTLREEKPGEPTGERDRPETSMKPGGETGTRDDL